VEGFKLTDELAKQKLTLQVMLVIQLIAAAGMSGIGSLSAAAARPTGAQLPPSLWLHTAAVPCQMLMVQLPSAWRLQ
jgi:hypothetical protein